MLQWLSPNTQHVFYIFNGDQLIGEINRNGVPQVAYTWGRDGLVSERLIPSSQSRYYHFGPQGETRYLTNAVGAITDTYTYQAYGKTVASSGTSYNPHRYGGKYGYFHDGLNGHLLIGRRWYSSYLMRWFTHDPIGYDGGTNLYQYVEGNPVGFVDPSGLDPLGTKIGAIIGSTVGGYIGGIFGGGAAVGATLGSGGVGAIAAPGIIGAGIAGGAVIGGAVGGIIGNGLGDLADFVNGLRNKSSSEVGSCSIEGDNKRHTPDQEALVELAKEASRKGGTTVVDAETLLKWADEYNISHRGPETHNSGSVVSREPHIHIGPIGHIPVR